MESNPLETELRREAAVVSRQGRADMRDDLERAVAKAAKYEATLNALRQDIKMLETIIDEYDRLASIEE